MTEEEEEAADKFEKLRQEAEEKLSDAIESTDGVSNEDAPGIKGLLHELQVHQVELELQNEELRETRTRLRKMKEKYVDLYHSAPISYLTLSEEGEVLDANMTAANKLQTQKEYLIGEDFYSYVVEEDRDSLYKHLRKVFKTENQRRCELKVAPGANGSAPEEVGESAEEEFHGLLESRVFENGEGEVVCRTALSDITERKGLELELKKSEQQYRSLFNSIRDAILVADIDGKIINCNPAFTELFGYELEEIEGEKTEYLYHDREEYERMGEEIKESLGDPNFFYTIHYEKKDGEVFPGETNVFYLRDDEGEVVGFIGLVRDISERMEREEALKRSEEKYRTVFEGTGTAMFIEDEMERISEVNEEFEHLTGYSAEEAEDGMDLQEFVAPEDLESVRENHQLRMEDPEEAPSTYSFSLKRKDGERRQVLINVSPLPDGVRFISSLVDITEEENAKQKLRQSFVQLAETTSRVLGVRDPYTQRHEQRVAELAREVGKRMDLDEEKLLGLYIGGVLHDIGKIIVPETILTKPGKLKDVEWEMIKSHPEVGYNQILKDTDFPWPVAEMTLHHHERLDGSGYPDGLEGDELTEEVRILAAVDVVEAMSTRRPYREARSKERTLNVLRDEKGTKLDPEVVDILVDMIEEGEVKFGNN
ncbi:MAG: PAS domain S-box protein [Candidatus Bipolaricaulota bacterium]